jgi:hypothetical protein
MASSRYVKDGINDFVVHGRLDAVNPAEEGTRPRRGITWS